MIGRLKKWLLAGVGLAGASLCAAEMTVPSETYPTIAAAVDAAGTEETVIRLVGEATSDAPVTIAAGQTIVLDLNDRTANGPIVCKGDLTVKDSGSGRTGVLQHDVSKRIGIQIEAGGVLTLDGGTVKALNADAWSCVQIEAGGTMRMNGGCITTAAADNALYNKGTLEIRGGAIGDGLKGRAIQNAGVARIRAEAGSAVALKGTGEFSALWLSGGTLVVSGAGVTVTGAINREATAAVVLCGGSYSVDPSAYVPAGFSVTGSANPWTVVADETGTATCRREISGTENWTVPDDSDEWGAPGVAAPGANAWTELTALGSATLALDDSAVALDNLIVAGGGASLAFAGNAGLTAKRTTVAASVDFSALAGNVDLGELKILPGGFVTVNERTAYTLLAGSRGSVRLMTENSDDVLLLVDGNVRLADALTAAGTTPTTIKLVGTPANQDVTIGEKQDIALDLNGRTLNACVENHGRFTVRDSSAGGTGVLQSTGKGQNTIKNYGSFILESGTVHAANAGAYTTVRGYAGGRMLVRGGVISTAANSWCVYNESGYALITGGRIDSSANKAGTGLCSIESGAYTEIGGIADVELKSADGGKVLQGSSPLVVRNPNARVTGPFSSSNSNLKLFAGTYSRDPTPYLAPGHVNDDGVVKPLDAVAATTGVDTTLEGLRENAVLTLTARMDGDATLTGDTALSVLTIAESEAEVALRGASAFSAQWTFVDAPADFSRLSGTVDLGNLRIAEGVTVYLNPETRYVPVGKTGTIRFRDAATGALLRTVGPDGTGADFASFAEAFAAEGAAPVCIKLLGEPSENAAAAVKTTVESSREVVLDLNGQSFNATFQVWDGGRLTVRDSSVEETGVLRSTEANQCVIEIRENGLFVLESGTLHSGNAAAYSTVRGYSGGRTMIRGGAVTTASGSWCLYNDHGRASITGGRFNAGTNGSGIMSTGGYTEIGGDGAVSVTASNASKAALNGTSDLFVFNPHMEASGTLTGGNLKLCAGLYDKDPTKFVPTGYASASTADGKYRVTATGGTPGAGETLFMTEDVDISGGDTEYGTICIPSGMTLTAKAGQFASLKGTGTLRLKEGELTYASGMRELTVRVADGATFSSVLGTYLPGSFTIVLEGGGAFCAKNAKANWQAAEIWSKIIVDESATDENPARIGSASEGDTAKFMGDVSLNGTLELASPHAGTARSYYVEGRIDGPGRLVYSDAKWVKFKNPDNRFTGGFLMKEGCGTLQALGVGTLFGCGDIVCAGGAIALDAGTRLTVAADCSLRDARVVGDVFFERGAIWAATRGGTAEATGEVSARDVLMLAGRGPFVAGSLGAGVFMLDPGCSLLVLGDVTDDAAARIFSANPRLATIVRKTTDDGDTLFKCVEKGFRLIFR